MSGPKLTYEPSFTLGKVRGFVETNSNSSAASFITADLRLSTFLAAIVCLISARLDRYPSNGDRNAKMKRLHVIKVVTCSQPRSS